MPDDPRLSRRAVLTGAGVLAVGAVAGIIAATRPSPESSAATATPTPTPSAPGTGAPERRFVSTALTAPAVTTWKTGTTAVGLLFVTQQVKAFHGLIMTEEGEPVWIEPTGANLTDLKVQTYQGRPVLTYWAGKSYGGHGDGVGVILDDIYAEVARVSAGNGVEADLHEFTLTDRGTALLIVYETVAADLSEIGGPVEGHVYDCRVQEVDVASGTVLLDWKAMDHIPIDETYLGLKQDKGHDGTTAGRAFDPFHLNSVEDDGDRLLVSARHTHTVYAIDRTSGEVLWRLGGRASDFTLAKGSGFAWQHDARRQADGTISLFDNHLYAAGDGHSRGMVFELDENAGTADLVQEYAYDDHLGTAMGSTQVLPGGNVLVGWGTVPAATEFTAGGTPVWEATLGGISYRAYRHEWRALPTTAPAVAAKTERDGVRVFASWNGATEVSRWRVLATGDPASVPRAVDEVAVSGFETSVLVPAAERVAVQALDASGRVLATSETVAV